MVNLSISLALLVVLLTRGYTVKTAHELLATILNDDMLHSCELIFVTVKGNKTNSNFTISSGTEINPILLPNYNAFEVSSGIFTVSQGHMTNNKNITIKYQRLKDIHRFTSKHCGVAVVHVSQVTPGLQQWLFDTLIPRYVPIIRKDEDHFLFIFDSEADADKILLSPQFGHKIKFKVGIVSRPDDTNKQGISNEPTTHLVDLYGQNGECTMGKFDNLRSSNVKFLFIDKRDFNGKRFQVVNPKAPSYFEMVPEGDGTYRPVRGLYKVWLDFMMERFNFTIRLTLSSASGSTGKRLKDGSWIGSVGDILTGRADMASFNGHIYNRHRYVDWSAPLTYEWMVFITHKPRSFFSASSIYRPFPVSLWIGFLIAVVLICLVLKVISKMIYRMDPLTFRGMIMFLFSSFLEQDGQMYLEVLHLYSVRVIVTFWLLFALVLSTAYRGKLVSLIAFPALTWVPTSFDELAYSNYRVGLNVFGKGGATYSVLSTSKSPVYQTFFKRMELYPDPVNCLKAAFENDLGCLMVKSVADFFGAKNFTDRFGRNPFRASEQTALFREDGYIWEKRAVFRKHFDRVTWSMMETGLTNLWFHNDLNQVKKKRLEWERLHPGASSTLKIPNQDDGPSTLQLAHLIGLFYLYVCGHVTGIGLIVWERIQFCRKTWTSKILAYK